MLLQKEDLIDALRVPVLYTAALAALLGVDAETISKVVDVM